VGLTIKEYTLRGKKSAFPPTFTFLDNPAEDLNKIIIIQQKKPPIPSGERGLIAPQNA
jgi:hypothetical protein